jgi:four helix bundle protein
MDRDLKDRTKKFSLEIIKLVSELLKTTVGLDLGKQLIRSGTSIDANYRSSKIGGSRAEFISKLSIVQEEAGETVFWLELTLKSNLLAPDRIKPTLNQANELTSIFTAMLINSKNNSAKKQPLFILPFLRNHIVFWKFSNFSL